MQKNLTQEEVKSLISIMESDFVERTISIKEDKLAPLICALSNDFPNHNQVGYILLGVNDNGTIAGKHWTDEDLQAIGNIRSNGNILPPPSLTISPVYKFPEGELVVIQVKPSSYPPVRYDGRCWIRVGPSTRKATLEEEKLLIERRSSHAKTYDLEPVLDANLEDLDINYFKTIYLPSAIEQETLQENQRTLEEQLASLRFYDLQKKCPTNVGILVFGINPEYYLPGAYLQYIKFSGEEMTSDVEFEKKFSGALITELNLINDFIKNNIIKQRPIRTHSFQEKIIFNYPHWALRELIMNAIMHRNYQSNAPIYVYEFTNRIEILNPGGLYGDVNPQNFPNTSDYRNVVLAEAMKILGYVNRFNYGVRRAIDELKKNGNGEPKFDLNLVTKFKVSIPIHTEW